MTTVFITIADPAHPPVRAMVEELDAYLVPLYPAESNHLLDIETLRQPEMRFFAAHRGPEVLAIGGCWLHADYAEVKRIYVTPAARGLGGGHRPCRHRHHRGRHRGHGPGAGTHGGAGAGRIHDARRL